MTEPTTTPADLDAFAAALRDARQRRTPIEPLTATAPDLSLAEAYAIAGRNVAADIAAGARRVGHKIGLTSATVQRQVGVSSPDYGVLLDTMEIADGHAVAADYIAPRVELEIAFVLGEALSGPDVTVADVGHATDHVRAAIELVDSRIADWRITLADTVADAASSGGFVLGAAAVPLADVAVTELSAGLWRGGELVERGHASEVLGDPCLAVAWLANALAELGDSLEAGEVVLSGACTRMVAAKAGDRFRGELDGLGAVELAFVGAPG